MRREAYRNSGNPGEEGDDCYQERGVAPRQDQEHKEERTCREETTVIGRQPASHYTARAIVKGASTPIAMINRNAIP
jgi:hypothetical protein